MDQKTRDMPMAYGVGFVKTLNDVPSPIYKFSIFNHGDGKSFSFSLFHLRIGALWGSHFCVGRHKAIAEEKNK